MPIDRILNELSFDPPAESVPLAMERMGRFIDLVKSCIQHNVTGDLRVPENFMQIVLAQDYDVSQWMKDHRVDRDSRLYLRQQATKSPFLADTKQQADEALGQECYFGGCQCRGLHAAYLLQGLCLSLASSAIWQCLQVNVELHSLTQSDIQKELVEVKHASMPEHLPLHQLWIEECTIVSFEDGNALWNLCTQRYPRLKFCGDTERQIRSLRRKDLLLRHVQNALQALERSAESWTTGDFDPRTIVGDVSNESDVTINQFGDRRRFRCPDEDAHRLFSWHFKISLRSWRIHFCWSQTETGLLRVGYIGTHLPTESYRH